MTTEPAILGAQAVLGNIENLVPLTSGQYTMGSLILMVSYGAHFAFILYFIMSSFQLAPRYRIVPIMSAIVMASAGRSGSCFSASPTSRPSCSTA
ncbi:hypothetical protein QQS45_07780 [Alteriqipengyuania flavescens]|uniref:hypothetical protein n=1 Tax=Alteriqipengyuania flavescens TaxID=3053610 RepID=UPI0025B54B94|nr:hypothetical protein [Alteriqipengyuania flavescens]WJY17560.1 hypothetical protein QQW98_07770 [Alteriqipengyuania flavescens]WJY23503.1 hypothetical protein QQS45_07780 [Alteriqipengyuania flavescens]